MKWELATVVTPCESFDCSYRTIMPGEPFRKVRRERWCWMCARRRLRETAPKDMPEQARPSAVKPDAAFHLFNRGAVGSTLRSSILTRRELERENANDPKLRQFPEDR